MEYLLKSSAVILIFFLLYKLLLHRETFFQTNRAYLIIGLLAAITLPFVVIPIYIEYTPVVIDNLTPVTIDAQTQKNSTSYVDINLIIYTVYGIGLLFFTGKLFIEFTSLKFLFNKHDSYKSGRYTLIETPENIQPFSFFYWILYNPSKYSKDELTDILNHEKIHAKELHSIDIILMQILCTVFWFNPFIWLYKKEVQQNLEFIADNKAQDFSKSEKNYQLVLLKSSVPKHKFLITNNFYNSQIKKRIIMLHKSKSNRLNAWKYSLILPILALFLFSFNTKEILIEKNSLDSKANTSSTEVSAQLNSFYEEIGFDKKPAALANKTVSNKNNQEANNKPLALGVKKTKSDGEISIALIHKNTTDADLEKIKVDLEKQGLAVKFKGVKRNKKGEITAIKIDAKSKKSSTNYQISSDDEAITPIKIVFDEENNSISIGNSKHGHDTFVYETKAGGTHKIHKTGDGSNVFVFTDEDYDFDHDSEHETKVIVRSKGQKGKVKKIKSNRNIQVISDDSDNKTIEVIVDDEDEDNGQKTMIVTGKGKNVWISKDGKEEIIVNGKSKKAVVHQIDDKDKTFVIDLDDSDNNISINSGDGKEPLYIIDGKEVSKDEITKMDPDKIESVTVLKDKNAIEKYGKKAKDGVIIIKTKKD